MSAILKHSVYFATASTSRRKARRYRSAKPSSDRPSIIGSSGAPNRRTSPIRTERVAPASVSVLTHRYARNDATSNQTSQQTRTTLSVIDMNAATARMGRNQVSDHISCSALTRNHCARADRKKILWNRKTKTTEHIPAITTSMGSRTIFVGGKISKAATITAASKATDEPK